MITNFVWCSFLGIEDILCSYITSVIHIFNEILVVFEIRLYLLFLQHWLYARLINYTIISASVTITRECLSTLRAFRTDIPADHYEGCRTASKDVRLAHYVFNNTIKELDIRRDYFDSTEFCFCFLDHRCNSSNSLVRSLKLILTLVMGSLAVRLFF